MNPIPPMPVMNPLLATLIAAAFCMLAILAAFIAIHRSDRPQPTRRERLRIVRRQQHAEPVDALVIRHLRGNGKADG